MRPEVPHIQITDEGAHNQGKNMVDRFTFEDVLNDVLDCKWQRKHTFIEVHHTARAYIANNLIDIWSIQ